MKFWPFGRETRAVGSYTELLIEAAYAQVSGGVASASTAAREVCAGHWGRAFASADLAPIGQVSDALRPFLAYIGRELIHVGEATFAIDFDGGLRLTPASGYTVMGDSNPSTWVYDLTLPGPTSTTTRTLSGDRVLHLTYATDSVQPWRGVGPLESAQATVALLSGLETQLGQEANSAAGSLIPVPQGVPMAGLQDDLRKLSGKLSLVPTTAGGFQAGFSQAPRGDYDVKRLGSNPPAGVVQLREDSQRSVLAACGVPTGVLGGETANSLRESYRQFLHGSIMPIAQRLALQVGERFDLDFAMNFDKLFASDLSGRARAFGSMVQGGMDVTKAATLAGLMEQDAD